MSLTPDSRLEIRYSDGAIRDLDDIWAWTAHHHGMDQAERYVEFIRSAIRLARSGDTTGRAISHRRDLLYLCVKWRKRSHGHSIVYRLTRDAIVVLRVLHTSQDWQSRIASEFPDEQE